MSMPPVDDETLREVEVHVGATGDPLDTLVTDESLANLPWPPAVRAVSGRYRDGARCVVVTLGDREPVTWRECVTLRHVDTIARVYLPASGWPYPYAVPR